MIRPLKLEISLLFQRLLAIKAYQELVRARWQELNELELFSPAGLKRRLREMIPRFEHLLTANFKRWPLNGPNYYDDNDFAAEIAIMEAFIDQRHAQLDSLIRPAAPSLRTNDDS